MKILIGADIVPTAENYQEFQERKTEKLIGSRLMGLFKSADAVILNLETPITDIETPLLPWRPSLFTPESVIPGLAAVNSCFYTIANNHILDQGEPGLYRTMELLSEQGIQFAGAGRDIREAAKPGVIEKNGIRIGIYCCSEHEFSIVTDKHGGANPYDPLESFDHVQHLKEQCDFAAVLYHGGKEHYRYPSPELQKRFHKFADKGADLVIAQHTHCVGCEEKYRKARLVYGQGNFLFASVHNEFWDEGLVIEIQIDEITGRWTVRYHPLIKTGNYVRYAGEKKGTEILEGFQKRSRQIKKDGYIKEKYEKYAKSMGYIYAKGIKGESNLWKRYCSKKNRNTFDYFYKDRQLLSLLNLIEDEAHRELEIVEMKRILREKGAFI